VFYTNTCSPVKPRAKLLEADHPVVVGDQAREVGRRQPARLQPLQIRVGRPTGDGAALSDVDRDSVLDELLQELPQWRDPDARDLLRFVARDELRRIADERDCALLPFGDRSVRGEVRGDRRARRVGGACARDVEDLHAATLRLRARPRNLPVVDSIAVTSVEQPFHADVAYYEDRAAGIATVDGTTIAAARQELARRHGFTGWDELRAYVEELPETPFVLAYRAVEASDADALAALLDEHVDLVHARGTNGNDLLGMAAANGDLSSVRLLLERGADVNRGNDHGWTPLHQAGYSNNGELACVLLARGARTDLGARGDGGTPLVMALFWGHRDVAGLLGDEPHNLRVAAGLGDVARIRELAGTPAAGARRGFYRPHGGFPAWTPSDDPHEILDEALVWAAKSDRVDALRALVDLGADVDADPYRGTALTWAAVNGHTKSVQTLLDLGADPNRRGTFGGPDHGEGVTALHLAAQAGRVAVIRMLLDAGADPTIRETAHDAPPAGWAEYGGHPEAAALLR
jgi:ankyrin repeat protein